MYFYEDIDDNLVPGDDAAGLGGVVPRLGVDAHHPLHPGTLPRPSAVMLASEA